MIRRLIINADDYGLCPQVDIAIEELVAAGRLRDLSVIANGETWRSAAQFMAAHPQISVGAHLNAVEGRPVSPAVEVELLTGGKSQEGQEDQEELMVGLRVLMARWIRRPSAVERAIELEWRAQLERLLSAGLRLSHADSHQHLHAFPPAWSCAFKLCREFGVPALRWPLERNRLPLRRLGSLALNTSLLVSKLARSNGKLRCNDHFLGFKRAGAYGLNELLSDLRALRPGLTEIALHPSAVDGAPYPNLSGNRERLALLDQSLPDRLAEFGIELTTWSEAAR